jgi:hypothetical protein
MIDTDLKGNWFDVGVIEMSPYPRIAVTNHVTTVARTFFAS